MSVQAPSTSTLHQVIPPSCSTPRRTACTSVPALAARDSTQIARTHVLTMQRQVFFVILQIILPVFEDFCLKSIVFGKYFVILQSHLPANGDSARRGAGWRSTTYQKASCCALFLVLRNYHNRITVKNNARVTATGCSIYSP